MANVTIGCRLPNGVILELPGKDSVTLKGQNSAQAGSPIIMLSADDCGYTQVDADFWAEWKKQHKGFAPLESNAIFEERSLNDAKAKQKELKAEKTGHEPLPQEVEGIQKRDE